MLLLISMLCSGIGPNVAGLNWHFEEVWIVQRNWAKGDCLMKKVKMEMSSDDVIEVLGRPDFHFGYGVGASTMVYSKGLYKLRIDFSFDKVVSKAGRLEPRSTVP